MTEEILANFEFKTENLTLVPSDGGTFEIEVDGTLVYSKLKTGRHIEPGEAAQLIHDYFQNG